MQRPHRESIQTFNPYNSDFSEQDGRVEAKRADISI